MRYRRGITPVVALVLLVIVTVAAVGGAAVWFMGIMEETQRDASSALGTQLDVRDVQCEAFRVSVAFKNTGKERISGEAAEVYLSHGNDLIAHKTQNLSDEEFLEPGGIGFMHVFFDQVLRPHTSYTVRVEFPFSDYSVERTCTSGTYLMNYWRFDEGSGQWANDSAGANHGIRGGTLSTEPSDPAWVSNCINDGCLAFDGSDTMVNLTSLGKFESQANGAITISAWVRIDGDTGDVQQVVETRTAGWEFFMETDGNMPYTMRFHITEDTGDRHEVDAGPYSAGDWHYFTGTYDGKRQRLYVDGELEAEAMWDGEFQITTSGKIGRDDESAIQHLDGRIDEVRMYNAALTGEAITTRYEDDLGIS